MSRKSDRRKTAAQRAAAAKPKAAQWRTTQETLAMTQISRTKLYKATKAGTFPKPIKIGKKCVWIDSEIKDWTMKKYNKQ